jgi:hypothetical protein
VTKAVELTGAADLKAVLDATVTVLEDLTAVNTDVAQLIRMSAIPRVPVRTGKLAGSLTPSGTAAGAEVTSMVPYAHPVHGGVPAKRIAPSPFLTSAVADVQPQIEELYLAAIDNALGKAK